MDRNVARRIIARALRVGQEMNPLAEAIETIDDLEERRIFRRRFAEIAGLIYTEIVRPIVAAHAEFDPDRDRSPIMKNILVIDPAENCSYSIFQATTDEFDEVFPEQGQDIEYVEDLTRRLGDGATKLLAAIWDRPIQKKDAIGIHGTLFFGMEYRKQFYTSKREADIDPRSIKCGTAQDV